MKKVILSVLIFSICQIIFGQDIPFMQSPDWESNVEGVSTGLGLADINGDGWKDIIVANGNDIARQHLVVYYNQGDGTFPVTPDWQSDDVDYHGHLAVGDVNGDGWIDVAVSVYIGENGFSDPGKVKVYYNQGGELEGTPSFQSYKFYTFSCALGDADGDGDLDLATTGGEPYSGLYDAGKVFLNHAGTFNNSPDWTSSFSFGSLDVDFGDMDGNGYLDLIFTSEETPNYIFLANDSGEISDTASWESTDPENYINSLDIGFVGSDKIPAFVVTGNDQLGGNGEVWQYRFPYGVPESGSNDWSSSHFGYGSGILLADIDNDDILDLIYGGWWLPVKIALGYPEGDFETDPSYTSSTNSVIEAIQMADLDRDNINIRTDTFPCNDLSGPVIFLKKQLVENILSVRINGVELNDSMYCNVPNKNRISFIQTYQPEDTLTVEYEYSNDCDLVISNWDSNRGNYIFYNTMVTSINLLARSDPGKLQIEIGPNPFHDRLNLQLHSEIKSGINIQLLDCTGRLIYRNSLNIDKNETIHYKIPNLNIENGIYLMTLESNRNIITRKVMKY